MLLVLSCFILHIVRRMSSRPSLPSDTPYFGVEMLCPFVRRVRVRSDTSRRVDPITVAGSLDMRVLRNLWKEEPFKLLAWVLAIAAALDPATVYDTTTVKTSWCGLSTERMAYMGVSAARMIKSSDALELVTTDLMSWKVLKEVPTLQSGNWNSIVWARVFTVEKGEDLLRVILDCRKINRAVAQPPPLRLATLREIADMLRYFPDPYCITLDLRHWFHQISIPDAVRRLFAVVVAERLMFSCTLPMGFSWAPAIAQAISATLLIKAMAEAGLTCDLKADTPYVPPVMVFRRDGKIAALAVIWYDNFLVVTPNDRGLAEAIKARFVAAANELKAVIKGEVLLQQGSCSFIGIQWKTCPNGQVTVSHVPGNIVDWAPLCQRRPETPRDLARILGVLSWDWQVSGRSVTALRPITFQASKLGQLCARGGDVWDTPVLDFFTSDEWEPLRLRLIETITRPPIAFQTSTPPAKTVSRIYVISDASDSGFATVYLSANLSPHILSWGLWREEQKEQHISWRETFAATAGLEKYLGRTDGVTPIHIVFGTDNSAARWATEHGFTPLDPLLAIRLANCHSVIAQQVKWLSVVFVPGKLNVADAPSRFFGDRDKVKWLPSNVFKDCKDHMDRELERRNLLEWE